MFTAEEVMWISFSIDVMVVLFTTFLIWVVANR